CCATLEIQPQSELHLARVGRGRNNAELAWGRDVRGSAVARKSWQVEVGVVEDVERIRTEFQSELVPDWEVLCQSQINIGIPRTAQAVALPCLQAEGSAECSHRLGLIREQLNGSCGRIGVDVSCDRGIIPVEYRRNIVVETQREGIGHAGESETRVPAVDAR